MRHRPVQDVSGLPDYAFGNRMTPFWGTLGFMALEGTGFALAAGAYLYLVWLNPQWPLADRPPDLLWSSLLTAVLIVSAWPNQMLKRNAKREDLPRIRRELLIMSFMAVAVLGIRAFEFGTLYVRWDQNAYGSIVWVLLGLHTAHILTDAIDTFVLTALMFTKHAKGKRFSDVEDNAIYWDFVVLSWLPIYGLIYWVPRL
jgi:heme/copper-type cytochrome/quinol oxidase subunit 3